MFIAFPPRSMSLLISWLAVTICSDFADQENKVYSYCYYFPIYLLWRDGTRCHDLSFLNVEFEANFFTLLFHFIKRLLSFSLLSAIRVVPSAYLRLLIFLSAILIPACASSSPGFLMMYSANKLNKQGDNIWPWHTPFPIWNQSAVPTLLLDLHTDFSGGRSGGLVFPALEEFSTVYCDPHSHVAESHGTARIKTL